MRSPAAYAGVEAYARKHAGTDAGALANLSLGYAHILDRDYAKALPALQKAQVRAGEVSDYVRYFQAQAYSGAGQSEKVVASLKDFGKNQQDSVFLRDAAALYANALVSEGQPKEAAKFLEANRTPTRADIELALGKAYLRSGDSAKGMETLRHLYFTMPLSPEATQAASELQAQGSALAGSYAETKQRADLLAKGGRWTDAVREYRSLLDTAPAEDRGNIQVMLGNALRRSGNDAEGRRLLEGAQATGEANAQRLYNLGEIARNANDEASVTANLDRMRQGSSGSPWFEQALLSAANMYLLKKDYDRAIDLFREMSVRFPSSGRSAYAHWKASWLTYRLRRGDAKQDFERQVQQYPSSNEVSAAIYWRARLAEDEGDTSMARSWYAKCAERFRNYYYGYLSSERLSKLSHPAGASSVRDPLLEKISGPSPLGDLVSQLTPPSDDLRYEKSKLLENAGLTDFAVKELQAADGGSGANWATLQIARIYRDAGMHYRALQFLKRAVPSYYSLDLSQLPREYWDFLFPTPYWGDLRRSATDAGLDPYLVASLIRQESEFNPGAVSRANAWGLMQLLPAVGKGEAKEVKLRKFSTESLLTPSINMQLGTRFFRKMIDHYNGHVEYALAAYNAGSNRVDDWRASGSFRDVEEFVESIPFTETREYVQAIMRNAVVYKKLYPQQYSEATKLETKQPSSTGR